MQKTATKLITELSKKHSNRSKALNLPTLKIQTISWSQDWTV